MALQQGCVSQTELRAMRGRSGIREILSLLLHFEPWKFPFLRKTKEALSTKCYKQVHRVQHSLRKFTLCLDQGKQDVFFITSVRITLSTKAERC